MNEKVMQNDNEEQNKTCEIIRKLVEQNRFDDCDKIICEEMSKHPHSPEPHNFFGILLERKGDKVLAMKHFRAAWSLDPAYLPARYNMERYSEFLSDSQYAFDENDCAKDKILDD